MAVAYRELLGTPQELGHSEHMRIRSTLRTAGQAIDRHGFTWRALGGTVAEETINWSDFTFGVELELIAPVDRHTMARRIADLHVTTNRWDVRYDGSLNGGGLQGFETMEVVSPILQGQEGLIALKQVMDLIRSLGGKVNSSCGLHVHIGVRGMAVGRVKKIAIAFLNAEHHFDSLVPTSRRSNRYCMSNLNRFGSHDRERLTNATSISGIANALNGGNSTQHYNSFRYYKLNFQSFVHHGTIEFRQHAGSVESDKACAWVRLVAGFCARAAREPQQEFGAHESFEQWVRAVTDEDGVTYMTARRAKFSTARAAA